MLREVWGLARVGKKCGGKRASSVLSIAFMLAKRIFFFTVPPFLPAFHFFIFILFYFTNSSALGAVSLF